MIRTKPQARLTVRRDCNAESDGRAIAKKARYYYQAPSLHAFSRIPADPTCMSFEAKKKHLATQNIWNVSLYHLRLFPFHKNPLASASFLTPQAKEAGQGTKINAFGNQAEFKPGSEDGSKTPKPSICHLSGFGCGRNE